MSNLKEQLEEKETEELEKMIDKLSNKIRESGPVSHTLAKRLQKKCVAEKILEKRMVGSKSEKSETEGQQGLESFA